MSVGPTCEPRQAQLGRYLRSAQSLSASLDVRQKSQHTAHRGAYAQKPETATDKYQDRCNFELADMEVADVQSTLMTVFTSTESPMGWLRQFDLPKEVVTCEEAAIAKGVPLERELKSLVLLTDDGPALAHIKADRTLLLRQVKNRLHTKQARLASSDLLQLLGVGPGTVSPFAEKLWALPHLIDTSLLQLDWVTTNNGTLDGYIVFDPILLGRARRVYFGEYSKIQ